MASDWDARRLSVFDHRYLRRIARLSNGELRCHVLGANNSPLTEAIALSRFR